jgi:hypothetical protein
MKYIALLAFAIGFSVVVTLLIAMRASHAMRLLRPPTSLQKRQKTLVILLGNARGGKCTWDTLNEHVLRPLSADLALLFDHGPDDDNQSLFNKAKHIWTDKVDFLKVWDKAADALGASAKDREYKNRPADNIHGGLKKGVRGSGGIIAAFRSVLVNEHADAVKEYDRIILTRSDHYYACDHPDVRPDEGLIYVPPDEGYGGLTDRHVVFHADDFEKVVDIVPFLIERKHRGNIETALRDMWKDNKLMVVPIGRTFFEVKRDEDNTRWGNASKNAWEHSDDGLNLKYPRTYETAKDNCEGASTLKEACRLMRNELLAKYPITNVFEREGQSEYPVFVNLYTGDNGYREHADRLMESLDRWNLSYYIVEIDSLGDKWESICQMKPHLIQQALDMTKKSVVWVDADATIENAPDEFLKIDASDKVWIVGKTKKSIK